MSSKCSYVMDRFFALDRNEKLPFWMTVHVLHCSECRTQIRMLTQAEKISSRDSTGSSLNSAGTINDVIFRLYPQKPVKKVSLFKWEISGIFLILGLIILSLLIKYVYKNQFQLQLSIFTGIVVSIYIICFVIGNMDFFIKRAGK